MKKYFYPLILLIFSLFTACSEGNTITPPPSNVYKDGEVITYMKASKGAGIDIVFMGDGFSSKQMAHGGYYEQSIKQAIDYMFKIEPYKSYRDYFTVKYVVAISEQDGVSTSSEVIDTKFTALFTGSGSEISIDQGVVQQYAFKALPTRNDLKDISVVVVANTTRYGGTTYMTTSGFSIAICPMSGRAAPLDFRGIVQHEAGGHGFGQLADEYISFETAVTQEELRKYNLLKVSGFYLNVDLIGERDQVKWNHFFDYPDQFKGVDVFEGAYCFRYGAWRSEETSCMILNIPYYNAVSREAIVMRIKRLANEEYSFADFMAKDVVENYPITPAIGSKSMEGGILFPAGTSEADLLPSPKLITE